MPTVPSLVLIALQAASVPLPGTSSVTVPMSPPEACAACHGGFDGAPFDTWAGTAMAHANRDPWFLAALQVAERDAPGVGDLCLRCHAPEAWVQGRCVPTDGSGLSADDWGITCSACHRMDPSPWGRNGQYRIGDDSALRGPWDDSMAPHHTQQSRWLRDARLCASCHDLYNPLVERRTATGTTSGLPFPEQTTYSEWAASAFATEGVGCVDCHMRDDPGPVAINAGARADRSRHELVGSNLFLLDAIAFLFPRLGLSTPIAQGRARTLALLATAARLELVDPPAEVDRGARLRLRVRVENRTGHKLPTGYPEGRRVFLSVRSEALELDRGEIDAMTGEPDRPLGLWRAVHGRAGEGPGHHLALNDTVFFDNRIPPRGFVPTATTAPVGAVYPAGPDGALEHWDEVTVTATVPCDPMLDRVEGRFRLWYESAPASAVRPVIEDLGADPAAQRLELAYGAVPPAPVELASLAFALPIRAASDCAPPDAGVEPDAGPPDTGAPPDAGVRLDAGAARPDAAPTDAGDRNGPEPAASGCGCAVTRTKSYGSALGLVLMLLGWCLRPGPSHRRVSVWPRSR